MSAPKLLICFLLVCLLALFYWFGGFDYLSLSGFKAVSVQVKQWLNLSPWLHGLIVFLVYLIIFSLPLPAAGITTMSAGYLFGFSVGLFMVSVATAIAAMIAFIICRYMAGDWVTGRFEKYHALLESEFEEAGFWYALSVRFIPGIPFFAINAVLSLTGIKLFSFALATLFGMLPVASVLVNAGVQLSKVEAISDVLTSSVMVSLLVLAMLPLLVRFLLKLTRSRLS